MYRVYLSGPDIFLPNSKDIDANKKAICERYGMAGVSQLDVNCERVFNGDAKAAEKIFEQARELISDCDQKSKILEQSAMWRSKPSPSKTWSRRLKRDSSISRLFTQTLKPSHSESFADAWTSSLVGSLVSPSQAQGNAQGQKTPAT